MLLAGSWFELIIAAIFTLILLATSIRPPFWLFRSSKKSKGTSNNSENILKKEINIKTVKDIPGPFAFPIIGTTWIFSCFGYYKMSKIHDAYKDLRRRYGSFCREESIWNYPVISIFSKNDIETILKKPSRYPLRPSQEIITAYRKSRQDRYTTVGLVNEQGVTWQKLRATLTPELTRAKTILGFFPALNGVTDDFIDLIRNRRAGCTVVGFEELAYRIGLESTCMLMLGRHLGFLNPESSSNLTSRLAEAVRIHFLASRDAFYGFPTWKLMSTSTYKHLIDSEDVIYNIITDLIETTLREQQGDAKDECIEAVFRSILKETGLDMRDKKAGIIDFIAAGIHTVGNTLVFLLHTLGTNLEVQKRVREEADSLAPPKCDITMDNLTNAHYIRAFITEVFRLVPTAPCIARILDETIDLGDYQLNAGTVVLLQTWLAGMEESNFKDADKCIPERWLETMTPHSPMLVAPFGFGRRICPGKRFVEQALQLMLAKIVREFEIKADEDLDLQFEFILAPKGPITLSFCDRQEAT